MTPNTAIMEVITENSMQVMNEEAKVEQVGNYMDDSDCKFDNPQCGRVYSVEGLSPTLNTCQGGQREPKILLDMEKTKSCASRKRGEQHNIETRKDDVANCVTSIDTDSMVAEPAVLTNRRTEEGKELRKQGIEKFENRQLVPREDGCSGTLTSVQKDNLLQEPSFLRAACGFGKPAEQDIPSAVTSSAYAANNFVKEPKIVGYTRDSKGNITNHHLQEHANTIHTCTGSGRNTDQYVAENTVKRFKIRKLIEREVFRLMDVSEKDIDKIQAAGISKTAQYKLAGNSIVVSCLYHLFRKLFVQTECETQQLTLF